MIYYGDTWVDIIPLFGLELQGWSMMEPLLRYCTVSSWSPCWRWAAGSESSVPDGPWLSRISLEVSRNDTEHPNRS